MEFVPSGTSDKLGTIQRRLAWPLSSTMTRTNREMVQFCPSSALMLRSLLYFFGRSDGGDVQMRFFELRVGNVDSRRKTDNLIVDSKMMTKQIQDAFKEFITREDIGK
ncbi:uncharacterized protein LOC107012409 isoform X2 [Solanum pennellii]|uniref:Uncharacterized protein LOC107012409 isoform X2 n=1 Tax=Solanum pennellii TaxID=28526 RepID=A0ABM1G982_SOLPN|nr:uncharacterized protein LOC107012409 isoform X2 [Solanum pennellii]